MKKITVLGFAASFILFVLVTRVVKVPVDYSFDDVTEIRVEGVHLVVVENRGISERAFRRFSFVIQDAEGIAEFDAAAGTVWMPPFAYSSHEGYSELYSVDLVRNNEVEKIQFTEREWFPGGVTPEGVLKIMRRRANQALQTTPMTRSVCEKTIEFGRPQRGV